MGVAYLGPIAVSFHGDPSFTFTGDATANGMQPTSISGLLGWDQGKQLKELVDNPDRRRNPSGVPGVLEPIWTDDGLLADFNGWYVLQNCQLSPSQVNSLGGGLLPFTLTATRVPDGAQPAGTRSARARANDFDLSAVALVANPVFHEDPEGGALVKNPGGTRFTREYDATSAHSTPALTPAADNDRNIAIYAGDVSTADPFDRVILPSLRGESGVPAWVSVRGGDCRAYDRRSERDVYGPGHPFKVCTDCILTNGLIRCWVGGRRMPAYLHVEAFAAGVWREVGIVQISTARLMAARLSEVMPDASVLALTLENEGDVFVTLKRGERMFRLGLPSSRVRPSWVGTPPQSRSVFAANGVGHFGLGLDGGGDDGTWEAPFVTWEGDDRFTWDGTRHDPDIRLYWPPEVAPTSLGRVLWWRPEKAAADLGGSGIFTAFGDGFRQAMRVYLDAADLRIKFSIGDSQVLAGPVQSFTAGQDVMIAFRFSTAHGMALSVRAPNGTVTHVADATLTDPVVDAWEEVAYYANWTRWGDGSWGDGVWGGATMFPDGVIDNDMCFDGWLSNAEVEALAAASHALDGLPSPEARLVWYGPFDAVPIPAFGAEVAGLAVDSATDGAGFQKAVAYLDAARLTAGVFLARADGAFDTAAAQHAQLAAEFEQTLAIR